MVEGNSLFALDVSVRKTGLRHAIGPAAGAASSQGMITPRHVVDQEPLILYAGGPRVVASPIGVREEPRVIETHARYHALA
jgi:hypothetical protein